MKCFHPVKRFVYTKGSGFGVDIFVPCKKCPACLANRARVWTSRLQDELSGYDKACFLTLTYSEEELAEIIDNYHVATLVKRHLQLFWKSLRQKLNKSLNGRKIRYFAVGEYGEEHERPHYHAIVFNLAPNEADDIIRRCWSRGFVCVGTCTTRSIAYVSRYVMKKLFGPEKQKYIKSGRVPPFQCSSNRPGIGFNYLKDNWEHLYRDGYDVKDGKRVGLPEYYKKFLFGDEEKQAILLQAERINREMERDISRRVKDVFFYGKSQRYYKDLNAQRESEYRQVTQARGKRGKL